MWVLFYSARAINAMLQIVKIIIHESREMFIESGTRIYWLGQQIVRKQLDIMPTYHYVQNQGKLCKVEKIAKNLNLGNFWRFRGQTSPNCKFFLKNRFHLNWRSYLVLTSGQKQKKTVRVVFEKNIKVSDFGLIWRPLREYLQIKNFFQKCGSVTFLPL